MTITEFLLARISEDEAPTWRLLPYRCPPGCCAPAGYVGHECLICQEESFGGTVDAITEIAEEHDERIHRRSRVLAECDAKRRIVEEFEQVCADYRTSHTPTLEGQRFGLLKATHLIAQPYADHPDFDPTWRL